MRDHLCTSQLYYRMLLFSNFNYCWFMSLLVKCSIPGRLACLFHWIEIKIVIDFSASLFFVVEFPMLSDGINQTSTFNCEILIKQMNVSPLTFFLQLFSNDFKILEEKKQMMRCWSLNQNYPNLINQITSI